MAANYLHGVETIEVDQGAKSISVVKSSVICLVGIAPIGPVNELTLVLSPAGAAQFGQQLPGFTIPQALDAIFKQGPATVVVVNTLANANLATVALESKTITNGKIKLDFAPVGNSPIGDVSIFLTNGTTPFSGVKDVDYSLDAFGNFTALSAVASEGLVLKFTYKKLDVGTITSSQIVGTNVSGTKTGTVLFENVFNTFGFYPKILLAPVSVELPAVATQLITLAEKYRAIALIDSPVGTTTTAAIAGRGPASTMNFKTSSDRAYLLHPHVKVFDLDTNANINAPYSSFMAGIISKTDLNEGYWVSPSNHEILGIVGPEYLITASVNDATTDANLLNEKGITTLFSGYGTGTRTWGNRSAMFPANTGVKNFISIRRVADIVHESLEQGMLTFIDKPLNQAVIDAIRDSANGFFKTLIGRGACLPGSRCEYSAENTPLELAAGHVTFDLIFMSPTPAERITFKSYIDINLLAQLA